MHQGAPADNDADDNSMSADNDAADTPIQRWQTPANDTDSETSESVCLFPPFECRFKRTGFLLSPPN